MDNGDNLRLVNARDALSFPVALEQRAVPTKLLLSKTVRDMRALETTYQDAIRAFQQHYIVEVLAMNGCHRGRAAKELGMHRNTLARVLRELDIDVRQIRNANQMRELT